MVEVFQAVVEVCQVVVAVCQTVVAVCQAGRVLTVLPLVYMMMAGVEGVGATGSCSCSAAACLPLVEQVENPLTES